MDTAVLKRIRFGRYIFALVMTILMVAIAEISGEKEIIFPEIVALTIGAWISERQPWNSNKRKMFLLVSLASVVGVCVVRYMHVPLIAEVITCFAFTGIALTLTRTTLIPIISACILPVYLQTTSWVYPLSVTTMALIIIFMQWCMEKFGLRPHNNYEPCNFDYKIELKKWSKLIIVFSLIALVPFNCNAIYFIAPPLIVTFTEFANIKSPLRKCPVRIFWILVLAAASGTVLREVLNMYLHLPLALCAAIACMILFATFERAHTLFPPAGAILLIPVILRIEDLKYFPVEVAIGAAILIPAAMLLFREKKITL